MYHFAPTFIVFLGVSYIFFFSNLERFRWRVLACLENNNLVELALYFLG